MSGQRDLHLPSIDIEDTLVVGRFCGEEYIFLSITQPMLMPTSGSRVTSKVSVGKVMKMLSSCQREYLNHGSHEWSHVSPGEDAFKATK